MNKLLQGYAQQIQQPPSPPRPKGLEQVSEVPEEEENDDSEGKQTPNSGLHRFPSLFSTPADRPTVHHKGGSDSSHPSRSTRKNAAQLLFKEELQRRCASLMITSQKLIAEDPDTPPSENYKEEQQSEEDIAEQTYTEVVESRNAAVGSSALAKSGSTKDSFQDNSADETYDVLATIQASQQRQETENVVNYIIDTDFEDPEPCLDQCEEEDVKEAEEHVENPVEEKVVMEDSRVTNSVNNRKTHRRTDSSAIDWHKLNKMITHSEIPEEDLFAQEEKADAQQNVEVICDTLEEDLVVEVSEPIETENNFAGEAEGEPTEEKIVSDTDIVNKSENESQ